MQILGVMSGSSLDGIDLALVDFYWISKPEKLGWKIIQRQCVSLSEKMTRLLSKAHEFKPDELDQLDQNFCKELSKIILNFQKDYSVDIDFIASHGHTIYHYPQKQKTLQIGNGKRLYALTKISVIADFRSQDLLLGGQGAPLAPIVEKYLFSGRDFYLNLGGIANITIGDSWSAFDICPCNQILNHYAQKLGLNYDDKGHIASQGTLNQELWTSLNTWTYYLQKAPKSLDNAQLKDHFIPLIDLHNLPVPDVLHTFCCHIAYQIKEAVAKQVDKSTLQPKALMATGGGVYHHFLLVKIKENLADFNIQLVIPADEIIQFKEAILMALMGFLKLENLPNCLASATGASRDHVAGTIYVN